jgi:hypothetical protein
VKGHLALHEKEGRAIWPFRKKKKIEEKCMCASLKKKRERGMPLSIRPQRETK